MCWHFIQDACQYFINSCSSRNDRSARQFGCIALEKAACELRRSAGKARANGNLQVNERVQCR